MKQGTIIESGTGRGNGDVHIRRIAHGGAANDLPISGIDNIGILAAQGFAALTVDDQWVHG
jgi:hypothetical protein